jgi:glycosyltransferase involved in cell wall biosynthesis
MSNKPKVLWVSDLAILTGFGRVSHSILNYLHNDFDIVGLGVNYRGDPHHYPYPIYPAGSGGKIFGEDRLCTILNNTKFDILYILNDSWIVNNYLEAIKKNVTMPLPKIVVYFPVDSMNHDPEWYSNFGMVSKAVTYTEFGRTVVNDHKCAPSLKLDIIPHGINQEIFYKKFTNRKDAKQALTAKNKSADSFVFLSAQRNQPRKKLDITMEGFRLFAEGKDDVLIHFHCGVRDAHIDVPKLAIRLGIDNKLILTNMNVGVQQVPDSALNDIYNSADVGLNTSLGEGWSLTNCEHALTGAPQIVADHSALTDLYKDCGLLVPTITNLTFDNSMTVGKLITPEALAGKMNLIYSDKDLYKTLSDKSIEKFSNPMYSWKVIAETWKELFLEVINN